MRKRRVKYGTLKRTDNLLDLSPMGRNIFISRDKQMQSRAAARLHMWMRAVLALAIIMAGCAAVAVFVIYLAPWLKSEMNISSGDDVSSSLVSSVSSVVPEYDSMGLPIYSEKESLFVINSNYPAESDFAPTLTEVNGIEVDYKIASALRLLTTAAKEDGLAFVFTEGYVSYEEQDSRFQSAVTELMEQKGLTKVMARTEAATTEPQPGQSDFQSGMCVRISGDPTTFADSRTCSWLRANMGKYGFVFRYPEYKDDYTGMNADLTVIRYVGSNSAAAMQQRSMCLEEYISYLKSQ